MMVESREDTTLNYFAFPCSQVMSLISCHRQISWNREDQKPLKVQSWQTSDIILESSSVTLYLSHLTSIKLLEKDIKIWHGVGERISLWVREVRRRAVNIKQQVRYVVNISCTSLSLEVTYMIGNSHNHVQVTGGIFDILFHRHNTYDFL